MIVRLSLDIARKIMMYLYTLLMKQHFMLHLRNQSRRSLQVGAAVFYDGDVCLGGGTIDKVYKDGKGD